MAIYKTERDGITPHKGGRDQMISLRLTADEVGLIDKMRGDDSRADYITNLVQREAADLVGVSITFPDDMLWQEASQDDYDDDATHDAYIASVTKALVKAGYDADVDFGGVTSTQIEGGDYDHIMSVIDSLSVDYYVEL